MRIYIAGPMRGVPKFNFPAFDLAAARIRAELFHPKRDNRVDGAGYFNCLDLLIEERQRREHAQAQ